jgi:hypothetical protein
MFSVMLVCVIVFSFFALAFTASASKRSASIPDYKDDDFSHIDYGVSLQRERDIEFAADTQAAEELREKPVISAFDGGGYSEMADILSGFFVDYYAILETGDLSAFKLDALDPITYLILKEMVFQHDVYNIRYGGISEVKLNQLSLLRVDIDDSFTTEVEAYSGASYEFAGEQSGYGSIFSIKITDGSVSEVRVESTDIDCRTDGLPVKSLAHR